MSLTLVAAVLCFVAWAILVFPMSVSTGVVHLLLAVGAVLWVRWWALRA